MMDYKNLLEMEFLSKKYDETQIPLYLSYPTTTWWKEHPDRALFDRSYHPVKQPFLYFHFPYCKKACYYCCCYKEITRDEQKKQTYINFLEKEFLQKMHILQVDSFRNVTHMHWGGGTPTYLSCRQIEQFFSVLAKKMEIADTPDSGISIEAYPDDGILGITKLQLLRDLGFNEISFGIQDFDHRIQEAINRNCELATVKKIIHQAMDVGLRVHIDLCYGLPFQGLHEFEKTVQHVVELSPDRVALFPYAHYPLLFPLQRRIPISSLPNSFIKVLLFKEARDILVACGYKQVGIDHFVKPENPLYKAACRKKIVKDFMGYSVDGRSSLLGFGSSAISFLGNSYFHNTIALNEYYDQVASHRLPLQHGMAYTLSQDDLLRHRIIQKSILCDFLIDKEEINRTFHVDFDTYFMAELITLAEYEKDNLVGPVTDDKIFITPQGKFFSRHIAHIFDKHYKANNQKISEMDTDVSHKGGALYELSTRIN